MQSKPFLKTGIGSLPYKDAKLAMKKILEADLDIPFWPQLPKRDFREGMVAQYIEGLPALSIKDNAVYFDESKKEEELAKFYEKFLDRDTDYFKISLEFSSGLEVFVENLRKKEIKQNYVKGQVTGLFTFASSITEKSGNALIYDSMMMDAFTTGLAMKALFQIKLFRSFGKEAVIFFDEPYLSCFGSAYAPISKEEVIKRYNQIIEILNEEASMIGVHCCGNTDWGMLLGLGLDIINFDAFDFAEKFLLYAQEIKKFLEQGGFIAWGIIPTSVDKIGKLEDLVKLLQKHFTNLTKKGIDLDLLKSRSIISPSCGLGTLSENESSIVIEALKKFKF